MERDTGMNQYRVFVITRRFFAFCFFVLVCLSPSLSWNRGIARAEVVDRIVAIVNNDIILLSELNRAVSFYEKAIRAKRLPPEEKKKLLYNARVEVLNQLINQKLTSQYAKELGIKINKLEVDQALEQLKRSMHYTDEDLRQGLEKEGYTMEQYRDQVKDQLLQRRILNFEVKSKVVVTPEDVEKYYKAHPEIYGIRKQYHLRNIIMRFAGTGGDKPKETVYAKMLDIHKQLENGASFKDLARRYSESSFAERGGDLGVFTLDDLSDQLREAIKGLKPGEFTPVLETPQGYQILFVDEIIEKRAISLQDATEEIKQKLYSQMLDKRFEKWITELKKKSYIKTML
ncbi:MAG: hypothetical protein B5M56_06810 [Desulfococcus sp. 4484_241]|nr:MAG: hypothetical protein B5M56_06810 [Desulfococcus sp. 4484_241]